MARQWTDEQMEVIGVRGQDLLVSAAAGSGKTAVLVERILRLVTDPVHPVDIDHLLVVTFTNAAAGEMRERIRTALEEALRKRPEDAHLQRQVTLVHQAMITTIHSFCNEVVRSHFHLLDIDPDFRVADELEIRLLREEVLSELLEEESAHPSPAFISFRNTFGGSKDDRGMAEVIDSFCRFSESYPWPEEYRHQMRDLYLVRDRRKLDESPWMRQLIRFVCDAGADSIQRLSAGLELTRRSGGPAGYEAAFAADLERMKEAFSFSGPSEDRTWEELSYDELRERVFAAASFGPIGRISKKDEVIEELKETAKSLRDGVKAEWKKLQEEQLYADSEMILKMLGDCAEVVTELVRLTDLFEERFAREKREQGILDFSDMEHLALRVLSERGEDGAVHPTQAALEYAHRFEEVMTDEYQDSNLVQEYILGCVSGKGEGAHNRFMVGDVKQSIYRFRQARPELFMEKHRIYPNDAVRGERQGQRRIELHRNFRSRPQVLEGVNLVFRQIMAEDVGAVAYDDEAALAAGARFPEPDPEHALFPEPGAEHAGRSDAMPRGDFLPELWLLEKEEGAEEAFIAEKIRALVGTFPVLDAESGAYRPARYQDIAVLMRSGRKSAGALQQALSDDGIPAYAGGGVGYFDSTEIAAVLSMLQILDNPHQDIPLATVLRSPMGGFSDDDLARIRTADRAGDFYQACLACASQEGEGEQLPGRLRRFLRLLEELRAEAAFTPVHRLIWRVLDLTGYADAVLAMPAGEQRRANLELLVERAVAFEQSAHPGLFRFLRYVNQLRESETDLGEAPVLAEGADVVRIMTIHKSKGLEFPIVIVCGLGRKFNQTDARAPLIMHPSLGIGCSYIDRKRHLRTTPILKSVLARSIAAENLGEELRVLYVAMTRAKEKLILTGAVADPDRALRSWFSTASFSGEVLPYHTRSRAGSFLDLVMPALMRHSCFVPMAREYGFSMGEEFARRRAFSDGGGFRVNLRRAGEEMAITAKEKEAVPELFGDGEDMGSGLERQERIYDPVLHAHLKRLLSEEASPLPIETSLPGKVTVTQLKERQSGYDPREDGAVSSWASPREGARRGTIYHRLLELMDFSRDAGEQITQLSLQGKLSEEEIGLLRPEKLEALRASELGRRMASAQRRGTLRRETPFTLGMAARDLRPDWDSDEMVLVQGIIDAWFEENGELILLDYKTDHVDRRGDPEGEALRERYQLQLSLYCRALERLTGKKVGEALIYSLDLERAIRL